MLYHVASIFDVDTYSKEIAPIIRALDKYRYQPLLMIVKKFQQSEKKSGGADGEDKNSGLNNVLSRHGSDLFNVEEYVSKKELDNRDIGKLLVEALDQFTTPCPSPGANWGVLHGALVSSGWSLEDAQLLLQGHPAYRLLKPEESGPYPKFIRDSDPYWFWFAPGRSKAGYITNTESKSLLSKLTRSSKLIDEFDFQSFPGIDASNPTVIKEFREYLADAYKDTVAMLKAAEAERMGLYMTLSS